jgi:hypothetical protein
MACVGNVEGEPPPSCKSSSDCPAGWLCVNLDNPTTGTCLPACPSPGTLCGDSAPVCNGECPGNVGCASDPVTHGCFCLQ